ncbi:MAG: UDP-N-acetylmuramoyl-L-alanine--D-glutamate ligase [Clostridia bacterium]|nr:UDP-N-acetylmuramoyl-L-alanine--D-glutamate ligase [Clostridia bacterium]
MTHSSFNGIQHAGILGLGVSGMGMLTYLADVGCPRITLRSHDACSLPTDALPFEEVRILTGERVYDDLCEQVLFLSPSVRRDAPPLCAAQARGVRLCSDAENFFSQVRGQVFAITGSDGKSTTTKIAELLLKTGQFSHVQLGGNIGYALSPMLAEDTQDAAYAVELSSFQLMYMTPHSRRALITGISENHLNWHKDMDEYIRAKCHITDRTEAFVLNADDPTVCRYVDRTPYAVYSMKQSTRELLRYGAQVVVSLEQDAIAVDGHARLPLSRIALGGAHNIQNYMAAMALCDGFYDSRALADIAAHFQGLPHRARCVATVRGVRYVDASIDSSPTRTITTLRAQPCRPILILCGRDKGLRIDELLIVLRTHVKAIVCAGEFGRQVYKRLQEADDRLDPSIPLRYETTLEGAVRVASTLAREGDTVLLSPAATSFDAYKNFEERARAFQQAAEALL